MMRLIDANLAQLIADQNLSVDAAGTVQWVLSHTRTVDAVAVVRCAQCRSFKHDENNDEWYCGESGADIDHGAAHKHFCSYGKRRG